MLNCFFSTPWLDVGVAITALLSVGGIGFVLGAVTYEYRIGRLIRAELKYNRS